MTAVDIHVVISPSVQKLHQTCCAVLAEGECACTKKGVTQNTAHTNAILNITTKMSNFVGLFSSLDNKNYLHVNIAFKKRGMRGL